MRLGFFDFKRKQQEHPDEGSDAVSVDTEDGGGLTRDELADLWDALADELDQLSLDDLDEQLSRSPETDPELEEWSDLDDEETLRAMVDDFVLAQSGGERASTTEGQPDLEDPEEAHEGDFDALAAAAFQDSVDEIGAGEDYYSQAEQEFDPESFDETAFLQDLQELQETGRSGAMMAAADLLSNMMEEDEAFAGEETEDDPAEEGEEDQDSLVLASEILKNFHDEVPESSDGEAPPKSLKLDGVTASGVVSDEVVLALMHRGVIRVAQVYDASRHRRNGEPLWRAMLDVEEVDRGELLAEVATQSDYVFCDEDVDFPVSNLVDNMRETMPPAVVRAFLEAGAVPVEIGIDPDTMSYRLIVGTDDPASPEVYASVEAIPMDVECRYLPTARLDEYLNEVYPNRPARKPRPPASDAREEPSGAEPNLRLDRTANHGDNDRAENRPWPKAGNADDSSSTEDGEVPISKPGVEQDISLLDRRAKKDRVVSALFKEGTISVDHVQKALQKYGQAGGKDALWRSLAEVPGVDRESIFTTAAKVYAFPRVKVDKEHPDPEFVMLIMETIAEERREDLLRLNLLPYEYAIDTETGGARLMFVTHDPARSDVHRLLAQLKVGRFELRYAPEAELLKVVTDIFPKRNEYLDRMSTGDEPAFDFGAEYQKEENELVDETALEAEMSRSVLLNLFEASLIEAVRQGASDIHVFPNPKRHIEIHFRVDGRLRRWHVDEKVSAEAFLAVVKDNSTNVDRFERDMAQDGFIQRRIDDILIRFRVSVLPIASANQEIRAESVVIRVLDDRKVLTDLSKLGMLPSALERVNHAISQPHGMVILTGPTGSGKSTTLVAALHQVINPEVNVLTIEDPVEYIINGVRQIKLSHKLDLEQAIRAVLRHDPDIVMVGEMRDKPTADLAIKLANTGHLTFSTLHTNDAPSAVSRLYKMGVEPFLLAYAINLVVAQRLLRKLCDRCKKPVDNKDAVLMERLGFSKEEMDSLTIYGPNHEDDCPRCNGIGYKGRRAISETLYFSQEIRHMVAESGEEIDEGAILKQAKKEGMLTLQDCAREIVRQGETSLDEMMRVTASD